MFQRENQGKKMEYSNLVSYIMATDGNELQQRSADTFVQVSLQGFSCLSFGFCRGLVAYGFTLNLLDNPFILCSPQNIILFQFQCTDILLVPGGL